MLNTRMKKLGMTQKPSEALLHSERRWGHNQNGTAGFIPDNPQGNLCITGVVDSIAFFQTNSLFSDLHLQATLEDDCALFTGRILDGLGPGVEAGLELSVQYFDHAVQVGGQQFEHGR